MAQKKRPRAVKSAPTSLHFRLCAMALVAVAGYFSVVPGAMGPDSEISGLETDPQIYLSRTFASLSYAGTDPVITGSVADLFRSSTFSGPNRLEKQDRRLPRIGVLELASSFLEVRTRLAALKSDLLDPTLSPQNAPVTPLKFENDETPRISVAAIDPALASDALLAIENVTPIDPSIPQPSLLTDQLAYSRENTPATERPVNAYSERDRWCMATAIYFEARGESYRGQVAVAQVVMNRVKHQLYPDTICAVVFQNQTWRNRCQFSFACDGVSERVNEPVAWEQAREITEKVTSGSLFLSEVADATHYHASYVRPNWASRMKRITRIGAHIFYRFRRG